MILLLHVSTTTSSVSLVVLSDFQFSKKIKIKIKYRIDKFFKKFKKFKNMEEVRQLLLKNNYFNLINVYPFEYFYNQ